MTFSNDTPLQIMWFDVYMEFNDIFPWRALKHVIWRLRLIEPLNYFETHYWRFRQTYFFENN